MRNAAVYEGSVSADAHTNTGQDLESRQKFKNFLVMNTGMMIQMSENTKVDSKINPKAAFFGWCSNYRGTNATSGVSTSRAPGGQEVLGNDSIRQQHSHNGHPQRVGDRVRQQSDPDPDHAYHQGDPLSVGGHDHIAEPPDCSHVQGGVAEERAHHDDLRWDAGGCRVQQHSRRYHQDRQPEVVQGCESSDVLPWDTGGRGEVVVRHGRQVDQLCQDEGDDELPQCEVMNEVDVFVGQVPPPRDKGEHTEQEHDVSSPSPDEGRGLSQKSSLQQCQQALSAPDRNQSDLEL